ncbi:MAG: hypothetical protein ACTHLR_12725 [Rhizomicrobium sp.]
MGKFGVGVGDDFPVDDGGRGNGNNANQEPPRDERAEFEEGKRRPDEYSARREEWRRQREEWRNDREEWRARRRAFKEKIRQAARESFGARSDYDDRYDYGGHNNGRFPFFLWPAIGLMIPILILALVISLIAAIFKSPFAFLALLALGVAFFMWRHGQYHHRHYGYHGHHRDYDFDLKPTYGGRQNPPPPKGEAPAPSNGAIVTPPPSSDEGKSAP